MPRKKLRTAFYTAREATGKTQEEVAREAGVRQSVISELETGAQTNPTWDVLSKVAQVLGVRPDQLLPPAKLPRIRSRPARIIGAPLYAEGIVA